jgi:hypothetical protein
MKMDTDRVEGILREYFPQNEPPGARERILSRAAREVQPAKRRMFVFVRWAFVAAALAIVGLSSLAENGRDARLATMIDGDERMSTSYSAAGIDDSTRWKRQVDTLLALASLDDVKEEGSL